MVVKYSSTLRVRSYECDIYGHVNNAVYLRYMLETAREAERGEGWWMPVVAQIAYLRPLRYGDSVEVQTSVVGYDGQVERRVFDLFGSDGERAAEGLIDATLVGADRLPCQPADEWLAQLPAGAGPLPRAEPLPELPPPPVGVYSMRRRVLWHEMETAEQAGPAACLEWTEDCGMGVLTAHGWPPARMAAEQFAILIHRNQIEYLAPARLGDELEVTTWASDVKHISALRHFVITRTADGTAIARVHSRGVWINLATGRPRRSPAGFLEDFAPNLVLTQDPQN